MRTLAITFLLVACSDPSPIVQVRVANMSTEMPSVRVCIEDEPIGDAVAYGAMTGYLDVALGRIGVCGGAARDFALGDGRFTVVVYGDPGEEAHPLELAVLPDEDAPPAEGRAKVRAFHTDIEAPSIDVGFPRPDGQRVLIFGDLAYGATPRVSTLGPVSERGYVDGIPAPFPAPRLFVWPSGSAMPLGSFDGALVPFAAGHTYSVFPAGRVQSGTPEAFACDDASSQCDRFIATR
jgi:hypothetical protein